jgi:hypothetical protein
VGGKKGAGLVQGKQASEWISGQGTAQVVRPERHLYGQGEGEVFVRVGREETGLAALSRAALRGWGKGISERGLGSKGDPGVTKRYIIP